MASTVDARLNGVKGKPLAMKANGSAKNLRGTIAPEAERFVGQLIDAAIYHSRKTPQEVAFEMDYADQTVISRWTNGVDLPVALVRILSSSAMRRGLVLAIAELPDDDIDSEHVVRVGRKRA